MRKTVVAALLVVMVATASPGADERSTIWIQSASDHRRVDVVLRQASVEKALRLLEVHLDRRITFGAGIDRIVDYEATRVTPVEALRGIVRAAGLRLDRSTSFWTVRNPDERQVFLDVVDEDARPIVREVANQCGWRNVVMDRSIGGKGTFRLRGVPCSLAIRTVLGSLGLRGRIEPNSVLVVER